MIASAGNFGLGKAAAARQKLPGPIPGQAGVSESSHNDALFDFSLLYDFIGLASRTQCLRFLFTFDNNLQE